MVGEVDRKYKLNFNNYFHNKKILEKSNRAICINLDDDENKWIYVEVGSINEGFHLEIPKKGKIEFHIETRFGLREDDAKTIYDNLKQKPEMSDFKPKGWSFNNIGYVFEYKKSYTDENKCFQKMENLIGELDKLVSDCENLIQYC